jgi:hypothetical protein
MIYIYFGVDIILFILFMYVYYLHRYIYYPFVFHESHSHLLHLSTRGSAQLDDRMTGWLGINTWSKKMLPQNRVKAILRPWFIKNALSYVVYQNLSKPKFLVCNFGASTYSNTAIWWLSQKRIANRRNRPTTFGGFLKCWIRKSQWLFQYYPLVI